MDRQSDSLSFPELLYNNIVKKVKVKLIIIYYTVSLINQKQMQ